MSFDMQNHLNNLTTEDPPYTDATVPDHWPRLAAQQIWTARREEGERLKVRIEMGYAPVPTDITEEQFDAFLWQNADEDVYDYLVALQGDQSGSKLPRNLPHMCDCGYCQDYTLKGSGAAYAGKDRGEWDAEKHMMVPWDIPPWYIYAPGVAHGWDYILEPKFSQSVLKAQLINHDYQEWMTTKYECAVLGDALGIDAAEVDLKLLGKEPTLTGPGCILHPRFDYGGVTTLPYKKEECGMSVDCLIALEGHYIDLYWEECEYEYESCLYLFDTGLGLDIHEAEEAELPEAVEMLTKVYGQFTSEHIIPYEEQIEWKINTGEIDFNLNDLGFDVDLLSLPINARAAPYYITDPQAFVANLVHVDISTIPAADMRCMHCWSNFDEVEDEMIELKNGSVQADNSPVKMPCPHGHLIGKTCLMQIIDAGDRLCPQCRAEIVRRNDPRSPHPSFGFNALEYSPIEYEDWS